MILFVVRTLRIAHGEYNYRLLWRCWRVPNILAIGSHLQKWRHDVSAIVATHIVYSGA